MGEYTLCRYCGTFFDSDENGPKSCSYHPKLPVHIGETGSRGDHADLWNFPCCDRTAVSDIVEGRDVRPEQTPGCSVSQHVPETGWSVFISYSRTDEGKAVIMENELRRRGHEAWRDRSELVGGADWREAIDEAVVRADHFLLLLTPRSVSSTEVARELALAVDRGKNVVPILLEACDIPLTVRGLNCIDWRDRFASDAWGFFARDGFNQLREAVLFASPDGVWVEPPKEASSPDNRSRRALRGRQTEKPQVVVVKEHGDTIGEIHPKRRYSWEPGHLVTLDGVVYVVREILQTSGSAVVAHVERARIHLLAPDE